MRTAFLTSCKFLRTNPPIRNPTIRRMEQSATIRNPRQSAIPGNPQSSTIRNPPQSAIPMPMEGPGIEPSSKNATTPQIPKSSALTTKRSILGELKMGGDKWEESAVKLSTGCKSASIPSFREIDHTVAELFLWRFFFGHPESLERTKTALFRPVAENRPSARQSAGAFCVPNRRKSA